MFSMRLRWSLLLLYLLAGACSRQPAAVQTNAGPLEPPAQVVQRKEQAEIDWSSVRLEAGDAWVDCSADYRQGDGRPVLSLAYLDLRNTMQDCRTSGLIRLRYKGKVSASFAALAERTGKVANDLGIGKRILDIDSGGGSVEAAMRAGDAIGERGRDRERALAGDEQVVGRVDGRIDGLVATRRGVRDLIGGAFGQLRPDLHRKGPGDRT